MILEVADWGRGARTAWVRMGLEAARHRETDDGFERVFEVRGHPAVERYNRIRREGRLDLRWGDRFLVTLTGSNIGDTTLREALRLLDFERLAALAP